MVTVAILGENDYQVGANGGIYHFGAAGFQGSTADKKMARPVVAMAN